MKKRKRELQRIFYKEGRTDIKLVEEYTNIRGKLRDISVKGVDYYATVESLPSSILDSKRREKEAWMRYVSCKNKEDLCGGWYCREGAAFMGFMFDYASLSLAATGIGIEGAIVTFSFSTANNCVHGIICKEYSSAIESEALAFASLLGSAKKLPGAVGAGADVVDMYFNLKKVFRPE